MKILQTLLIWLATCCPLWATEPTPAVGRVWIVDQGNISAMGSCVLVSRSPAIALTAAHVVDNLDEHSMISVHFGEQTSVAAYKATIVESRAEVDLAVLAVGGGLDLPPRPITWEPVAKGYRVWQSGWGHRSPRSRWGKVIELKPAGAVKEYPLVTPLVVCTPLARLGDSGCGAFDQHGRLFGIVTATREHTFVVPLSENQWIKKHLEKRHER